MEPASHSSAPAGQGRRAARALAGALTTLALVVPATAANAATLNVANKTQFDAAVKKAKAGDTIQLANGSYPKLFIKAATYSGNVTISGTRLAKLGALELLRSSNITLSGVSVTPTDGTRSQLRVTDSRNIVVDNVLFDGRDQSLGSGVTTQTSATGVVIKNSEFTNCGRGTRCLGTGAKSLTVANNNFHDCYDCDFIRGGGEYVTIIGNTLNRAVPGDCVGGAAVCPHNDLLQIMGGHHWYVADNRFGERRIGAAQLYINAASYQAVGMSDIVVENNLFTGNPMTYAVRMGTGSAAGNTPPTGIKLVNNTILTGDVSAVRIDSGYGTLPVMDRPVLANNVFRNFGKVNCGYATYSSNVMQNGAACVATDKVGQPNLDSASLPTVNSTLVVDTADPALAPAYDGRGYGRDAAPDRGAFELVGPDAVKRTSNAILLPW